MRIIDLFEAPISDFHHVGNFDKSHGFRHVQDRKLVTNPKALEKIKSMWKHPSETFFNIILLNTPLASSQKYQMTERGVVDLDHLENNLKPEVYEQVFAALDMHKANIIYTGNDGAMREPLTGWMMAHRLGHALGAGKRNPWGGGKNDSATYYFDEASKEFERTVSGILKDNYGIVSPHSMIPLGTKGPVVGFMRSFCKTRTAREGTLTRPYEVIYESLAQYMFSGKVSFNPLPMRFKYGPSWRSFRGDEDEYGYATDLVEGLEYTMTEMFATALSYCEGKIFVM